MSNVMFLKKNTNKLLFPSLVSAAVALASLTFVPSTVAQGDDHGHHIDEHEQKGAHGGKLLEQGKFTLEVTVFENGIPPEMRLFGYYDGKLLKPDDFTVTVRLDRLGGQQDSLSFTSEGDYLVSNQTVVEPHSYVVNIDATYQGQSFDWHYENFEGRTQVSDRVLSLSNVETEIAAGKKLSFSDTLYGTIAPINNRVFSVNAAYDGLIEQLNVVVGDKVTKGQVLAKVRNPKTLQRFDVLAPASGQVTEQFLNIGDSTSAGAIVEIADLSKVWVDLSAFPNNIEKLALGQQVTVIDNHDEHRAQSTLSYISPVMTGGHIARARSVIDNSHGHWRPGMHVKALVQTMSKQVTLAVKASALQTFREMPVVFAKFGNTFEVRMLELGDTNGEYVEVLSGLKSGTEYVTTNSYLFKADILKDGATHDH